MNNVLSRIALGLGLAALVAGCAAQADDPPATDTPATDTPADEPEAENIGTAAQADTLGAPPFCTYKQSGKYQYWLVGCHNGVGTSELFRCEPASGGKYRWYGQPQVGFKKTSCGN